MAGEEEVLHELQAYLASICPAILGLEGAESLQKALESPEAAALLSSFASDVQPSALFVELEDPAASAAAAAADGAGRRSSAAAGDERPRSAAAGGFWFGLDTRHVEDAPGLAVIKRHPGGLEPSKRRPLQSQLQLMSFPGSDAAQSDAPGAEGDGGGKAEKEVAPIGSVFAVLQAYSTHVFAPTVRAYAATRGGDDKLDSGVSVLQRRITELEQALDRCQKRLEIPTVALTAHPEVEAASRKVGDGRKVDLDAVGLGKRVQEDAFLNQVQAGVHVWVKDIQKLANLTNRSFPESAAEEIHFWSSIGEALEMTSSELRSSRVEVTRAVLNQGKRFVAVMALDSDTGLKDAMEVAADANGFLRTFPLQSLLAAQSPKDVKSALPAIFGHFQQKLKLSPRYKPGRAAQLMESVSRAFAQQLSLCLEDTSGDADKRTGLMSMAYGDFAAFMADVDKAFSTWDKEYKAFAVFFAEHCKRRSTARSGVLGATSAASLLEGLHWEHPPLKQRVGEVSAFRKQHENLRGVLQTVLSDDDRSAVAEVDEAYARLPGSDVLDLGADGSRRWTEAREAYDRRVDGLEARVSALLEGRLRAARTAEEMFRVFAKFNPLFVRPRIRASIAQFQQELIGHVREAVSAIQDKFRHRYEVSEAKALASLRDIPPVAGKILWARQMERQLRLLSMRLSDVLGEGWENHVDGRPLKAVCDELLRNLDTKRVYRQWMDEWTSHSEEIVHDHLLLKVVQDRKGHPTLAINFDDKTTQLFKEVRHLQFLGLLVTEGDSAGGGVSRIQRMASKAQERYPTAVALGGILRTYSQTRASLTPETERLLVTPLKVVMDHISEAFNPPRKARPGAGRPSTERMVWGQEGLGNWVALLAEQVFTLQEKAEEVSTLVVTAAERLAALDKCPFEANSMGSALAALQEVVDGMSLAGCSNLNAWVRDLDKKVEGVLAKRLEKAVNSWVQAFAFDASDEENDGGGGGGDSDRDGGGSASEGDGEAPEDMAALQMECTVHEVLLKNQVLYLSPPLEHARAAWIHQFHAYLHTAAGLPRLRSKSFAVLGAGEGSSDYQRVVKALPRESLKRAYQEIETRLAEVGEYVSAWLQYQSLWDMPVAAVRSRLGSDVSLWCQMLTEAKAARAVVESSSREKAFGPVIVDYSSVQAKVNLKYDAWQKELQGSFATILAEETLQAHHVLSEAKTRLEGSMLEGSTDDVVKGVTYIQEMRQRQKALAKQTEALCHGERLLARQRYQFGEGWPQTSMVEAAYADFETILGRRGRAMEERIPLLRGKVGSEAKGLEKRLHVLSQEWEAGRPLSKDHTPSEALETLGRFETMTAKLGSESKLLSSARDALSLEPMERDVLGPMQAEITDLREVWDAMSKVWESISELEEAPWSTAVPRKIRKSLDVVQEGMRNLPNRVRQYEPFDHAQVTLRARSESLPLLSELRSESLKDRHWRPLLRRLGIRVAYSELNLGLLWGCSLMAHKKDIAETVLSAQGEMALEEFLRQVREDWQGRELELVSYQGRIQLVKGWDALFSRLEEHLNGLQSMRASPHFHAVQEFQEEAALWEERLTKLNAVLDAWVDVQRRWLYLEGIFFASRDIKQQLPSEFARFKSVDAEFMQLMRRVAHKPNIMEVLAMENLLRQLERQEGLMSHIQKALGEYLEGQRQAFSRFYFVGDEDLLEIVGNANEPAKVAQHLGKMFASVAALNMPTGDGGDSPGNALSMISKDGEEVAFKTPVAVADNGVKEWLKGLETEMRSTLALLLREAVGASGSLTTSKEDAGAFVGLCNQFPAQIVALAAQVSWSGSVLTSLKASQAGTPGGLKACLDGLAWRLLAMSESVLGDSPPALRKKYEQLITELVRQRDATRRLKDADAATTESFEWLSQLRFDFDPNAKDPTQGLTVRMADAKFEYGFEYLGIGERLVQTPLTDRCYLTLTQALHLRMGGNPFGPAGTGKTESVKALGAQLGRFVLVFNCDESFDYSAMGRLFAGLCQVGAWGCFDEFNRLEERILSAVSQQILAIQKGLLDRQPKVEILGRSVRLHPDVGIFVTMNPGYAGRSNLPDNLKQLFRAVAMVVPDRKLIAQVMLFSQGISTAEELAGRIVLLFQLCEEQLSSQSHYDFGLRALKSVLVGAGGLKRKALQEAVASGAGIGSSSGEGEQAAGAGLGGGDPTVLGPVERDVLIRSACNTVVPKLVSHDYALFASLVNGVFPGCQVSTMSEDGLREKLKIVCTGRHLLMGEAWVQKVLQLKQVLELRHGVMMVGPSGSGKTSAWRCLLAALEMLDGVKGEAHIIDPKAIGNKALYGSLDPTTLEWTDGIFTKVLREVLTNKRGERARRHWIVFDGDVDPDWAENLNSVLDDNKILTLPSGERLEVPDNVRIMLEVDNLQYATLATVSRCGMVWFSAAEAAAGIDSDTPANPGTVTNDMLLRHKIMRLRSDPVSLLEGSPSAVGGGVPGGEAAGGGQGLAPSTAQLDFAQALEPHFHAAGPLVPGTDGGGGFDDERLFPVALALALSRPQVMTSTRERLVESVCSLLERGVALVLEYNEGHPDFPLPADTLERFAVRWLLHSLMWGLGGSMDAKGRAELGEVLIHHSGLAPPVDGADLTSLQVRVEDGEWVAWSDSVPKTQLEPHRIVSSDVVITTTDTVRHVEVLKAWLASHKPLILCGPPGSGKTMTLTSTLQAMPNLVLASLNFSSSTDPNLILQAFQQHCEYVRTPRGVVLQPMASLGLDKWLVVFCDEINLPSQDKYGTQRVVSFLRQLTEQGGFWRASDKTWVKLNRVQFVGACNPPTDAGRQVLPPRFLRHAPLLLVDSPAQESLEQIYGAFNAALLKLHPPLRGHLDGLTNAMIEFYFLNQAKFTADQHPQYIYSPRELSRWVRALYEAMNPLDAMTLDELVRLWANEALRLFHDRLVTQEERDWCQEKVDEVALKHFPGVHSALERPLLYSSWLSKDYISVKQEDLRQFLLARLKIFYEEELDVPLVLFDGVLEHVLRIDRVLRQPMGHLLLVGEAGAGKTVLSRFVSWMNGLAIFQVKASNRYTLENFDQDLRTVMWRVGVQGEQVCFIFDESNVLSPAFLERMNALLASGEVPGLYEGKELTALMAGCREAAQRDGVLIDSEDELFRRFTNKVQRGLHVVFTMNPASDGFAGRCATSPALFNRCVVDWFGTWPTKALAQVGYEFTSHVDTGTSEWDIDEAHPLMEALEGLLEGDGQMPRRALVAALVGVHGSVKEASVNPPLHSSAVRHYVSPRDFLGLIRAFVSLVNEKRAELEDQQLHINLGLNKLRETQAGVEDMQKGLAEKERRLREKDELANAKLQQMVSGQNEAERRKGEAEILSKDLQQQNDRIAQRRHQAETELSEAEPALLSAQSSVRSIKKPQLDEIRTLTRPPPAVQTVLTAVAIMLGHHEPTWSEVRRVISKADFIATVVNFDTDSLTSAVIKTVEDVFKAAGDLTADAVTRASKACGPLYNWVNSQINFSRIAIMVQPLKDEIVALQLESDKATEEMNVIEAQIDDLQKSIARYKDEYAEAIREIEAVKSEMEAVKQKVSRAEALLRNLEQERDRWSLSSESFTKQLQSLIGDGLLAAAFVTYVGVFDYRTRKSLLAEWRVILTDIGVPFRQELSLRQYLSTAKQRLEWQGMGLPADDLCLENAVVLERFSHRYPLVVDPAGQATRFLLNKYKDRKIATTSFLDASFMKTLASAIRFGTPLLVQDVETVDPVLNPLLNRELQRTGGRTLIRLGSEDIDFSPDFLLLLVTRNPGARFAPDLCSRVTIVNFTVTPASLQSQALGSLLRAERPDVEQRRTQMLQLQGEQSVKLRQLEERLLDTISAVEGTILDDDTVVKALEDLKGEAGDVAKEVEHTRDVMSEVEAVSNQYEALAVSCSQLYFALETLRDVHFLYHFSLRFFQDILAKVLASSKQSAKSMAEAAGGKVDATARLAVLKTRLFRAVCRRVCKGLLNKDRLLFALRLAQLYVEDDMDKSPTQEELEMLLRAAGVGAGVSTSRAGGGGVPSIPGRELSERQARDVGALLSLPSLQPLASHLSAHPEEWGRVLDEDAGERFVPADDGWTADGVSCERRAFLALAVVHALRPDRTMAAAEGLVEAVFSGGEGGGEGGGVQEEAESGLPWNEVLDLEASVKEGPGPEAPVLLCSEAGHDASWKVDALAGSMSRPMQSVSMGSSEGFDMADRALHLASKQGSWVLLRNTHLCPEWLGGLEKKLRGLSLHPSFRLFLTSEVHPRLPPGLLRASEVLVVEAPSGVRANVLRFLTGIPKERISKRPVERSRLYVLLAWLQAVVQERLRYVPLGWSKRYEFSEADAACALQAIDSWVDGAAHGAQHISPEKVPWEALRALLGQSVYGGRVDSVFDQELLEGFVASLFQPACFDLNFPLCSAQEGDSAQASALVTLPDATSPDAFVKWANSLPASNPPTWLGLAPNAEAALLAARGEQLLSTWQLIQDDGSWAEAAAVALASGDEAGSGSGGGGQEARLEQLLQRTQSWLARLPKAMDKAGSASGSADKDGSDEGDALHRCLCRELSTGSALLAKVRGDLTAVEKLCKGEAKATNEVRSLVSSLAKDAVPASWKAGLVQADMGVAGWVEDLVKRLEHLASVSKAGGPKTGPGAAPYWLGGLFSPDAFVTASRQHVAGALSCSLDELGLSLAVGGKGETGPEGSSMAFPITGLVLEGAGWDEASKTLAFSKDHRKALAVCQLCWTRRPDGAADGSGHGSEAGVSVPVYLHGRRSELIVTVELSVPDNMPPLLWRQRGVALLAWAPPV